MLTIIIIYTFLSYKVDINDGSYTIFSYIQNASNLSGIVYYQNFLYVVAFYASVFDGVYKIDISNGNNESLFTSNEYQFSSSDNIFIAVDNNGNFYITDPYQESLLKFDNNGNLLQSNFIITNNRYNNILFNNNFFYLSNLNLNQISKYDINGTLITNNYATGGRTYFGGGMAFDSNGNFYVSNETNGGGAGNVTINILSNSSSIICFKDDSKILTNKGYIPIQHLRKGDLIKTLNHDYKAIDMIGKREIYHPALQERIKDQLYKCSQSEYAEIFEPLIITGCHSILVDSFTDEEQKQKVIEVNGKIYVTDNKYRLPACADPRASIYETHGTYTIYHLALENDDYYMNYGIYANGLLVETCSKRYLKELSNMTLIVQDHTL